MRQLSASPGGKPRNQRSYLDLYNTYPITKAVERAVRAVIRDSEGLCKKSEREGFVKSQIESRNTMPKFDRDSGYPQELHLYTLYSTVSSGSAEEEYNTAHSRGRCIVTGC
ncbi:hypothetical protein AVEN_89232-1 [Araneus ventricosus]|uniref:Uncharacterized protein n=1 Tax=Araneus ventricosus TaxID=182803 RepID=A0A4Y2L4I5_ARAVE|nr:hypothetical protein AVEN_89232-1 [Araneus ventricosus]